MPPPQVHDLLRIRPGASLLTSAPSDWAARALRTTPWVVTRRAASIEGWTPVGVRGDGREKRLAGLISSDDILEVVRPEELRLRRPVRRHAAFEVMAKLAPELDRTRCAWGPVGAAGFELATGHPALRSSSDLDIVLRVGAFAELISLHALLRAARESAVRVDILVETPRGAAALEELLGDARQILIRASAGPTLVSRNVLEATLWPRPS